MFTKDALGYRIGDELGLGILASIPRSWWELENTISTAVEWTAERSTSAGAIVAAVEVHPLRGAILHSCKGFPSEKHMRVAWTQALEINVIYRGVETMLHLSLKLKGPTIIALRSSKFLGTLTKVIRQTSSSVCTRWVAYGCEKKPKDERVTEIRKLSCGLLMDNNKTFVICNYVGSRELSERFRVAVGAGSNFQSRKSLWVSWSHQERWNLCCRSRCILSRCKRLVNSLELVAYRGKVCFWRTDILNLRNCPGSCTHRALCKSPNFGTAAYR